jgi:hypothetical protein
MVIAGANYKIPSPDPIGLPLQSMFSTPPEPIMPGPDLRA